MPPLCTLLNSYLLSNFIGLEDEPDATARSSRQSSDSHRRPPDPNNPMEYCSRVPPPQQVASTSAVPPPTVMVPVGVLKREGEYRLGTAASLHAYVSIAI